MKETTDIIEMETIHELILYLKEHGELTGYCEGQPYVFMLGEKAHKYLKKSL